MSPWSEFTSELVPMGHSYISKSAGGGEMLMSEGTGGLFGQYVTGKGRTVSCPIKVTHKITG